MNIAVAAMLVGAALAAAALCLIAALRKPAPDLAATFDQFQPAPESATITHDSGARINRLGTWALATFHLTPSTSLLTELRLRGISPAEHFGARLTCALIGAFVPAAISSLLGVGVTIPLATVLIGGLAGWFYPALQLRSTAARTRADAFEALQVFVDLVVLERLSNASVTSALTNAAAVSDAPLFVQIRGALNRADLEQDSPWRHLQILAERINMPGLADVANVASLEQQGASLEAALRARVREFRDAHLRLLHNQARQATDQMELPKTLPVLIVTLVFLAPPLMTIAVS